MVRLRIIGVDRNLHQAQAQYAGVEVQIALRIAGYGGHVMEAL
jgi:hypothetical protein